MRISDSLRATLRDIHLVTDAADLAKVRKPLEDFKSSSCPYLAFIPPPHAHPDEYAFNADSAFVITKISKNGETEYSPTIEDREPSKVEPRQVRHVLASPGRNLIVPIHRFESPWRIPFLNDHFRQNETIDRMADQLGMRTGGNLLDQLEGHICPALAASAKHQGRHISVAADQASGKLAEVVDSIEGPSSVLMNQKDFRQVTGNFAHQNMRDIGAFGLLRPCRGVPVGTILVVADRPDEVGFVREKISPEIVSYAVDGTDGLCVAIGLFGVAVWGNAPVTLIEIGSAK